VIAPAPEPATSENLCANGEPWDANGNCSNSSSAPTYVSPPTTTYVSAPTPSGNYCADGTPWDANGNCNKSSSAPVKMWTPPAPTVSYVSAPST